MPVRPLIVAGVLGLLPQLAAAEAAGPPIAAATAGLPGEQVDTSGLSYYASRHDTAHLEAELRRLRSLYPNWQPPADPASLAAPVAVDARIQPLWDLFGADRLDDLDAAMAALKAADASFAPPPELVDKVAAKRARMALLTASGRKDYGRVIDIAARSPDLLTPGDIEVNWTVADAYGRSGDSDRALKLDEAILGSTQDPAARLATVRKAVVSLAPADLQKLIDMGKTGPNGRAEFGAVGLDLVRQRVGLTLAGTAAAETNPDDVARLEGSAHAGDAVDAALLGWLASKRRAWAEADTWFQLALVSGPAPAQAKPEDAKVAQGAVIALRALGRSADAENLAYRWHEADPALALLYLDGVQADLTRPRPIAIASDRLKLFSDLVVRDQTGDGAQALGWYAYNIGQFPAAEAWFRRALAWRPRDSTALGLALSLKRMGDGAGLAAFLRENGPTFPSLASVAAGRPPTVGTADPGPRPRRPAPARVARPRSARGDGAAGATAGRAGCSASGAGPSAAASLQAGWCLMALDRPREAAMAFATARGGTGSGAADAAYGQALANLRSRRTADAVAAAEGGALSPAHRQEIGLSALAQSAAASFDQGRYEDTLATLDRRRTFASEPRDLEVLRAWSTYHLGERDSARSIFATLDRQLSTSETRSGLTATQPSTR